MGLDNVDEDRRRAEVFDALSHPTRILILKALNEGPLGFADLKKKLGIESSGHLQHHLSKLGSLVKTDDYGKYALSDHGKDALLSVETVEKVTESETKKNKAHGFNFNVLLKSAVVALALLLVATSTLAAFEYNQTASLQNLVGERDNLISQFNSTLENRDTFILELNTEANWAKAVPEIRQPLGSQYLNMLSDSNQTGNSTKILLNSTSIGYDYGPTYPFDIQWFNSTTHYGTSEKTVELTDNRSITVSFFGWKWFSNGDYTGVTFFGGDPYLMIRVAVTNDYTSADAGNGTDSNAPIGNSSSGYLSLISLTARLYSQNGSIIQAKEPYNLQPGIAQNAQQFVLGSGETTQVVFYLSPSSINIDHYEIFVSFLSSGRLG